MAFGTATGTGGGGGGAAAPLSSFPAITLVASCSCGVNMVGLLVIVVVGEDAVVEDALIFCFATFAAGLLATAAKIPTPRVAAAPKASDGCNFQRSLTKSADMKCSLVRGLLKILTSISDNKLHGNAKHKDRQCVIASALTPFLFLLFSISAKRRANSLSSSSMIRLRSSSSSFRRVRYALPAPIAARGAKGAMSALGLNEPGALPALALRCLPLLVGMDFSTSCLTLVFSARSRFFCSFAVASSALPSDIPNFAICSESTEPDGARRTLSFGRTRDDVDDWDTPWSTSACLDGWNPETTDGGTATAIRTAVATRRRIFFWHRKQFKCFRLAHVSSVPTQ